MAELVVVGPESTQRWQREIPDGEAVRIGRKPKTGWSVTWDGHISREHAEVLLDNGKLTVRRLAAARNPIHFQGKAVQQFTMSAGQEFRIGSTTFQFSMDSADSDQTVTALPTDINKTFGQYQIIKRLGAGGMGIVYLATDTKLNRKVALKVLDKEKAETPTLIQRFRSEAQAAATLRHVNIVTTYEAGEVDGNHFIALEYVDGTDVDRLIKKRGALPFKRSLDIVKQVARALQHAFEQGIVHRDIKPANLLITRDGSVKLADMGLARSMEDAEETRITRAGTTVGTVDYMSPEQGRNSALADTRSDIYSLGCTWYEMLTGQVVFPEGSLTNKLQAHANESPPDPRSISTDVPEAMVAVLYRMLAKQPDERYQTPDELLKDLENSNLTQEALTSNLLAALLDDEDDEEPVEVVPSSQRSTSINVKCRKCGTTYKVSSKVSGKRVKCKSCGGPILVRET